MLFFKKKRGSAAVPSDKPCTAPGAIKSEAHGVSFRGCAVSTVGCTRTNNEDNYILDGHMNDHDANHSRVSVSPWDTSGKWHFAGVFDGMGGGDKGEIAAHRAAEIFLKKASQIQDLSTKSDVDLALRSAFLEANNAIVALRGQYNIFGTTGTVLCTNLDEFKIFHLGDSRAYLIRDHKLFQLTYDQTLAQLKIEAGLYQAQDPHAEADKHKLTEFIGKDSTCQHIHPLESQWIPIQAADRILLCSDGLYDMCSEDEIRQILWQNDHAEDQAQKLTEAACRNGGKDNVTCVIAQMVSGR